MISFQLRGGNRIEFSLQGDGQQGAFAFLGNLHATSFWTTALRIGIAGHPGFLDAVPVILYALMKDTIYQLHIHVLTQCSSEHIVLGFLVCMHINGLKLPRLDALCSQKCVN